MDFKITVAVDAMGGDHAPEEIVKGAVMAVNDRPDIKVNLFGDQDAVNAELDKYEYNKDQIEVTHTTQLISMDESPTIAIRKKKDSSLVRAIRSVKEGTCDAVVSGGSSGAVLVGGQVLVGKGKGVKRAPLAPLIPTENGVSLLVDCGANVDARPEHLVQFAKMGYIYMKDVVGIPDPKVGLVNIGVEEEKGNALTKETYPLLKACKDINFIGNVEARDISKGVADVYVTEAFAGNIILKFMEGLAGTLLSAVKEGLMTTTRSKIGGLLIKPALKTTLKKFDATEYGGAPLLGLKGLVVKIHGSAKAKETKNAIFQCVSFKEERISEKIVEQIAREKAAEDAAKREA